MASLKTFMLSVVAIASSVIAQSSDSAQPFNFGSSTATGSTAHPTGPVMTLTVPGGIDNQILVGSLIGVTSSMTTVAVTCPAGTDPNDCGFSPAITLTAGPSTLHFVIDYESEYTVDQACQISAGGAVCTISQTGAASFIETATTGDPATLTGIESTASVITFNATDISTAEITITAGQTAALVSGGASSVTESSSTGTVKSSGSSSATAKSSTATAASAASGSSSSHATSTSASSALANDIKVLAPGAAAAGLMGLAAILL